MLQQFIISVHLTPAVSQTELVRSSQALPDSQPLTPVTSRGT